MQISRPYFGVFFLCYETILDFKVYCCIIKGIKKRHKSEETTKRKKVVDDKIKDVLLDIYYRFDIAVNVGDLINLSSDTDITAVNELIIQQVQLGA